MARIYPEYPLTDLEKDIRPEDFKPGSIYHELATYCPASLVILGKYCENISDKLTLRDKRAITRNAYKRDLLRRNARNN